MLTQSSTGIISYMPSSAQSSLVIGTKALSGTTLSAITFDLEVDTTATVVLADSLTGNSYTLHFPPAVQRFELAATSLTPLPADNRRHLEDGLTRFLILKILESPPETPLRLKHINEITASPTATPSQRPTKVNGWTSSSHLSPALRPPRANPRVHNPAHNRYTYPKPLPVQPI